MTTQRKRGVFCVGSAERNVPTWMRNGDTFEERRRRIEGGTLMNEQDRSAVRKLDKGKQYSADKKKDSRLIPWVVAVSNAMDTNN